MGTGWEVKPPFNFFNFGPFWGEKKRGGAAVGVGFNPQNWGPRFNFQKKKGRPLLNGTFPPGGFQPNFYWFPFSYLGIGGNKRPLGAFGIKRGGTPLGGVSPEEPKGAFRVVLRPGKGPGSKKGELLGAFNINPLLGWERPRGEKIFFSFFLGPLGATGGEPSREFFYTPGFGTRGVFGGPLGRGLTGDSFWGKFGEVWETPPFGAGREKA